jgi:hypothetical protein
VGDELFDELLDRAVSSYSASEPLAGLEERVLGRVGSSSCERVKRAVDWRWALAGAAVIVALVMPEVRRERSQPNVAVQKIRPARDVQAVHQEPGLMHFAKVRRAERPKNGAVKVRPSREELLLVRFVATNPSRASEAFASVRNQVEGDLRIEALSVKPIEVERLQR